MDKFQQPFVLEMLNNMKEYYQMPAFWTDKEKNYSIGVGYCPSCNAIKNITSTRRSYDGSDCNGDHFSSRSVPLQCFDRRHEGVIKFSPQDFDSFLKYIAFFKKNKGFLEKFELKSLDSNKEMPNVKVTNKTYELFRDLINKWEIDEIKSMHNPDYINTNEFATIVNNYEMWNLVGEKTQIEDIKSLHNLSKKYKEISGKYKKEISGIEEILNS
jgi:hypothetical protein